jgi:hypothetical protein
MKLCRAAMKNTCRQDGAGKNSFSCQTIVVEIFIVLTLVLKTNSLFGKFLVTIFGLF